MPDWISIPLIILILIAFNGLYVLSEFSTVSARRARIAQEAERGNKSAAYILSIIESPTKLDAYVATSQVGITLSSLILGFVGQGQLAEVLTPYLSGLGNLSEGTVQSISAFVILFFLSLFQVLLGELVPKNIGIQEPERFAVLTSKPLRWSGWVFKPLIWLFNGSGILLMRLFGIEPSGEHGHIHSPEEIALLVEESGAGGAISQEEERLLSNTLRMREAMVKHVMIPRANMLSIPDTLSVMQAFKIITDSPYSRLPIFNETIDNIIGIVHLRDLFCSLQIGKAASSIKEFLRPVLIVPESMQVKDVFALLQRRRFQVAIILDEYGGTSGMVTLEDLIEEIFGDLQDEFDPTLPDIVAVSETQIRVRGDKPITELNAALGISLPTKPADTIGGLIMSMIGHIPASKEDATIQDYHFKVESMKGRAIANLLVTVPKAVVDYFEEQA
jgi:CBS domain containing-hemolysin-like protein